MSVDQSSSSPQTTTTVLARLTNKQPKVQDFLDSIARNSKKSMEVYGFALSLFQTFLGYKFNQGEDYSLETIIDLIRKDEINLYTLLDNFVSYLLSDIRGKGRPLAPKSIALYVSAVRSYLSYNEIEIIPSKFKRRVRLPKYHRQDEDPIDSNDVRKILLSCNNRRLKAYLLVLASSGLRAIEALALRNRELDLSSSPAKIQVRPEFAKTRVGRDVYISDEAKKFLVEWLDYKYRKRSKHQTPKIHPEDLVFTKHLFRKTAIKPEGLYLKIIEEFNNILKTIGMDERKEGMLRRKVTLHSFRRLVKTVISTQVGQDYLEWFLGHAKSPY